MATLKTSLEANYDGRTGGQSDLQGHELPLCPKNHLEIILFGKPQKYGLPPSSQKVYILNCGLFYFWRWSLGLFSLFETFFKAFLNVLI